MKWRVCRLLDPRRQKRCIDNGIRDYKVKRWAGGGILCQPIGSNSWSRKDRATIIRLRSRCSGIRRGQRGICRHVFRVAIRAASNTLRLASGQRGCGNSQHNRQQHRRDEMYSQLHFPASQPTLMQNSDSTQ